MSARNAGSVQGSFVTFLKDLDRRLRSVERRRPTGDGSGGGETVCDCEDGTDGVDGVDGTDGVGVPAGGTTGQVLAKDSGTDYDTEWVDQTGGSGTPDVSYFNVMDYGAVGDGAADDRAAIQAALSAAGEGQVVYFPPGVYALASMTIAGDRILRTYANQTLRGAGRAASRILVTDSFGDYATVIGLLNGSTYCGTWAMQDLCIDQNADNGNALNIGSMATYPRVAVLVGSAVAGGSVTITDCAFDNGDNVNTLYLYANEINISNNLFRGQGGPVGTSQHDCSTIYTTSYLANATQAITDNVMHGVLGSGGALTAIETHGGSQVITGNAITGYGQGMNLTGISQDSFPTDGVTCTGNSITRCAFGVHLWSQYTAGLTSGTAMRNVVVADNVISCDREAWTGVTGLLWYAEGIFTDPLNDAPIEGLTIANNQITVLPITATVASDYHSAGINLEVISTSAEIRDLHIRGNTIIHPLSTGIHLAANIARARISENMVLNPAQSSEASVNAAFGAAVTVFRTLSDVQIDRNQMIDTRGTHEADYCVYSNPAAVTNGYARHNMVRYTDAVAPQCAFFPAANTSGAQFFIEESSSNGGVPFFNVRAGSKVTNTTTGGVVRQTTNPVGTAWTADAMLTDGDKGDVTVSSSGTVWTVDSYVNVRNFGAVGNGVTDDTAAIQAAIDYILGGNPAAGAGAVRAALRPLYFPKGTYLTTAAPQIVSCHGFHMFGDGDGSQIVVSGTRTYGVEFNGVYDSYIHDLVMIGATASDNVRDGWAINWIPASAMRSCTDNTFARLQVRNLKYVNGFGLGVDSIAFQMDQLHVEDCLASGQWTAGETTWWQTGFISGSGTHGNILNHNYSSCIANANRYNLYVNAVNANWVGGAVGFAEADFRQEGARPLAVSELRSETSDRLFIQNGGASYSSYASFSDILWSGDSIHADGYFMKIAYGGAVTVKNLRVEGAGATAPTVRFEQGTSPARSCQFTAIGVTTETALTSFFTSASANATANIVVSGYTQINSSGQVTAQTPLWVKGLQGTSNSTVEDLEIDAALNHDGTTAGFYGTTPITVPTSVTARAALQNLGLGVTLTADPADYGQPGGAITWVQIFDTGTGSGDPGNTQFRLNNATQNTATTIYCDDLDENSVDVRGIISELNAGGSLSLLGHLRLVEYGVPTNWLFFVVTARVLSTGHSIITVTNESSSSASPFTDGDRVILTFTPMGLEGEQGDPGDTGAPGTGPTIVANNAARDAAFPSPAEGEQCNVLSDSTGNPSQQYYDGSGWLATDLSRIAYTPTLSGITIGTGGNALLAGTYQRNGWLNTLTFDAILGSSGQSVSTGNTFTVPSGMDAEFPTGTFQSDRSDHGQANYVVAGSGYSGYCRVESTTTVRLLVQNVAATYPVNGGLSSTIPATWAAGNVLHARITYLLDDPYE